MFYDILNNLCVSRGTTVTGLLKKLNISTSKGTAWKNGSVPNGEIVAKIAEHLNISTDYLLGMDHKIILSQIDTLCAQKGITRAKALIESGAGKDFAVNIQKGSKPSAEKIKRIANYFNVSTDYLLDNDTSKVKDPPTDNDIKLALFGTVEVDNALYDDVKKIAKTLYESKHDRENK